jgi:hypothetical protein
MRRRSISFHFVFPHVLLAVVLIGFAPTLYLRVITDPQPIPFYLHLHGVLLTLWYLLLALQAWLVRSGNTATHRKLGYWFAGYGVVVIAGGLLATLNVVSRQLALGATFEADMAELVPELGMPPGIQFLPFISGVVWANLAMVVAFAILLGAAVLLRRQPDWHKRLILLASLSILPPALARISRWELFGGESATTITIMLFVLIGVMVVQDLVSLRKVHKATINGFAVILVSTMAAGAIGTSAFGQDFVRWLGN